MKKKWEKSICISGCALMYALAYLCPTFLWPTVFLCLMPLFWYRSFGKKISFKDGFLWGAFTYALQLSALGRVIIMHGHGTWRYSAFFVLLLPFCVLSGVWFCLLSIRWCKKMVDIMWVACVTVLFFMAVDMVVLTPFFGQMCGYPFSFPLLPLMHVPEMLEGISYGSSSIFLLFCLIFFQILLVKKRIYALFFLLPFVIGLCVQKKGDNTWQSYFYKVVKVSKVHSEYEQASNICHACLHAKQKAKNTTALVLAESVYPYVVDQQSPVVKLLRENVIDNCVRSVIFGGYRKEGDKCYNSFFVCTKDTLIYYDKKHLIPFFEDNDNAIARFFGLHYLFYKNKTSFTAGAIQASQICSTDICYVPALCSELFWQMPRSQHVIGLVNDSYFVGTYFYGLMRLCAMYKAKARGVSLLYVGMNE